MEEEGREGEETERTEREKEKARARRRRKERALEGAHGVLGAIDGVDVHALEVLGEDVVELGVALERVVARVELGLARALDGGRARRGPVAAHGGRLGRIATRHGDGETRGRRTGE